MHKYKCKIRTDCTPFSGSLQSMHHQMEGCIWKCTKCVETRTHFWINAVHIRQNSFSKLLILHYAHLRRKMEGWTWCSSPLLTTKHWTNGFSIPYSRVSGHLSREQTESLVTDSCHHGNENRICLPMIATCSFQRLQWWVCYYNLTLLVPRHWDNSIKNRTVSREEKKLMGEESCGYREDLQTIYTE